MVRCESNLKYENIYGIKKNFFLVGTGAGGGDFEEHMWINFLLHIDMRGQNFDIKNSESLISV